MRRLALFLAAFLLSVPVLAQQPFSLVPPTFVANLNVTATNSSAATQIPTFPSAAAPAINIYNDGTVQAFVNFGNQFVTATTSNLPVPAGKNVCISGLNLAVNPTLYIAAITASSSTTLRISQWSSCPVSANQPVTTVGSIAPGNIPLFFSPNQIEDSGYSPSSLPLSLPHNEIYVGSISGLAVAVAMSGDCTIVASGAITCTTLNSVSPGALFPLNAGTGLAASAGNLNLQPAAASTIGGVESITCASHQWLSTISIAGVPVCSQPAVGDISGLGTGVATALGVNVGTAGAFVVNGGALGTPSGGTLTNATGLPIGGITGLGTDVASLLAAAASATTWTCSVLSNAATSCSTDATNASNISSGTLSASRIPNTISSITSNTWTPTATTSGTVVTPAYTTQFGSYFEFCPNGASTGCQIIAYFTLVLSGWTGSPTGNMLIAGLPVTSNNTTNDFGSCLISNFATSTSFAWVTAQVLNNTTQITLKSTAAGGATTASAIAQSAAGTTPAFVGTCFYHN